MICFVVLAHIEPLHFVRLCETLTDGGQQVVAHVDAGVDIEQFQRSAPPSVHFVTNRVSVNWGGFSMIKATLRAFRLAREVAPTATHYWLVSGDSYPIRAPKQLESWLSRYPETQFIDLLPFPAPEIDKQLERISRVHIERRKGGRFNRVLGIISRHSRSPYKYLLQGMRPFCGSQWLALTGSAVDYVLKQTSQRPAFVCLARTSQVPDEFFFQTLIGNSIFNSVRQPAPIFIRWQGWSARPLTTKDIDWLAQPEQASEVTPYGRAAMLMARKFTSADQHVVDLVERKLWNLPT